MAVDVHEYPTIIAKPYLQTLLDTPQRREYQLFLLENIVSCLALMAASDMMAFYEDLKKQSRKGVDGGEDKAAKEQLEAIRKRLILDLNQMSLGKWNHLLRDTAGLIGEYRDRRKFFIPQICDFYYTSPKKPSPAAQKINELITIDRGERDRQNHHR